MNGAASPLTRHHGKPLPRSWTRRALVLGALLIFELAHVSFVRVAAGADTIDAVWKPHRVVFVYRGHTTKYTCGGLKRKLAAILKSLGAHDSVVFERTDCVPGEGIRLYVRFMSPVEATDANVRALTTYTSEELLAARVRGTRLPTAEDLVRFPAVWQQVSFARDRRLRMTPSDCELVESIRRQILPRLTASVTSNRLICMPGTLGISPPRLVVNTLVAADLGAGGLK